ncbi:TonB-dependent siderophore receptor [Rhodoplanes sp. Z2-YC6860]|uniref:TonB-dependent siderophore receptor n=1 Tax=Rhodoplanes sp. Z2-YC6860 TaxID=674703 RepID=UPI00082D61BE|nr:TonB-dependent siderophore receptor [Rhodoplanes sp. Z2-YC6860]
MISYAALTTSLAAQQQAKVSPAARDARAQAQSDQSVSLPRINVHRAKPQPRRRVAVRPAPAPPPAAPRPVVQGERGTGPVSGYTASQSVTATKTDTPVLETPQSISVVTKDQATAQGAQTLTQALHYVPGVTFDTYSSNTFFDAIKVRGFDAPQYLDGLRLPKDPGTQFAIPRIEPYGLERFEVLKGPSSGLYGQTEPGGLVNMVSKRPVFTPFVEMIGQTGSFDRLQGSFDAGGPLGGKDSKFAYRITGLARDSGTQYDYQQDNKLFIAPSLTYQPTPDTSFTFLSHYQKIDNKGFQQYVPGVGSLYGNPNGRIPSSRYIGEPNVDGYRLEQYGIGYAFEHRINEIFQFRQNLRFLSNGMDLAATRPEGLAGDLRTVSRSMNYVQADTRDFAIDNQLQADFFTGPFKHKVLAGIDYIDIKSQSDYRSTFISPINMFAPNYGAFVPSASSLAPIILRDDTQKQTGIYLQDQIKFDRFTLTLTGRHDEASQESVSKGSFPPPGVTRSDDRADTGRVGLNYLFDFGLAPYVSYSTSFNPALGTTLSGSPFKPTTGTGQEIGVKYKPPGSNLLFTAAAFDITQQNVLTADPSNVFFSVQTGEVEVKGFEFEVRGNVTRNLEIVGGYSHLDPRVTRSNDGNVGNFMVNVPREQASLWGVYTWYNGPLAGFGIGAGVRYVGEAYADNANQVRIPSYTLYDAALYYDFAYLRPDLKGWKAQLNALNLFDHYYVASCVINVNYCGMGQARTVLLALKYNWQQEDSPQRGLITK